METGQKTIQSKNNLNQNNIKDLSIQISLSGLSFCILNKTQNLIEFNQYEVFDKKANPFELLERLKSALESYPPLAQSFSNVLVIYQNELSNLVPKQFFIEQQSADYLKFNSKILNTDFISYDEIVFNESINVYVPYVNINNFIFDNFGVFEYKHASTILIDTILRKEINTEAASLFLNFNAQNFELIAIKNKKLQLYNSFEYTTKEDVIYFLLFTIEQLHFNPENVKLNLMGAITKDDDLYALIYNYIRFVAFYIPSYTFKFLTELTPAHNHNDAIILNSF